MGPLAGLRVVDWSTGIAGPRAAGFLADYGADVVLVEPPGGSPDRAAHRVAYSVYHRGKRSVTIDASDPSQAAAIEALLASADVLVENWGDDDQAPIARARIREIAPHLVHCTITPFGPAGEHAHLPEREALVHAAAGTMYEQIGHRAGPIFEGLPFASIGAAYLTVIGALSSIYRRATDGRGRAVETSLFDGAHAYLTMLFSMKWPDRIGAKVTSHEIDLHSQIPTGTRLVTGSYLCSDGEYVGVHTGGVGAFGRLMQLTGLDDRVPPSESGMDMSVPLQPHEREVLEELHDIFASAPRDVWVQRLVEADVCGIPVLRAGEVFDAAQARHNRMVVEVDDPDLGRVEQVAPPIKFSRSSTDVERPAPTPGQHTDEVLGRLGRGESPWSGEQRWLGSEPATDAPLLAGVRVLDMGAYYAGPYSSRLLADLGADVIKLEPTRGDQFRGTNGMFRAAQAGKRSIALDLGRPEARAIAARLMAESDIVCHNMRPGVAERLGIDYAAARAANPQVLYGHAVGWGSSGPNSSWQSFEPMMSGFVGVEFEVAGRYNSPLYPAGNADPGNGLAGACGMLMALLDRLHTGQGQSFENAQLNATMTHLAHIVRGDGVLYGAERLDPMQYGFSALERVYETADGWVVIAVTAQGELDALVSVLGIDGPVALPGPETDDGDAEQYALASSIGDAVASWKTAELVEAFAAAGVPALEPVPYDTARFMSDEANLSIGRVMEYEHAVDGPRREIGLLIRLSDVPERPGRGAPGLGEHTAAVLAELGTTDDEIAKLVAEGIAR